MKVALALLVAVWTVASEATALLVYEPFDYGAGVLDGQTATGQNLVGAYTGSIVPPGFDLQVVSPGLGYGSLVGAPAASGNHLSQALGTTAATATAAFGDAVILAPGSEIYFSALFRLDQSANGTHLANIVLTDDDTGDTLLFGESPVGGRNVRIAATTAATGGVALAAGADPAFADGDVLFLIGHYVNSALPQGDAIELIAYDTADADLLPATFDPSDPNADVAVGLSGVDIDLARLSSVTFTIRGASNNFIDELRIGSTYRSVVPEPASAALLGAGLVALTVARRRRTPGRLDRRPAPAAGASRGSAAPLP